MRGPDHAARWRRSMALSALAALALAAALVSLPSTRASCPTPAGPDKIVVVNAPKPFYSWQECTWVCGKSPHARPAVLVSKRVRLRLRTRVVSAEL